MTRVKNGVSKLYGTEFCDSLFPASFMQRALVKCCMPALTRLACPFRMLVSSMSCVLTVYVWSRA